VPEYELAQLAELFEGKVGSQGRLEALFPLNANANVGFHNHADIVAAVADRSDALAARV